jgi:hypothetical protein
MSKKPGRQAKKAKPTTTPRRAASAPRNPKSNEAGVQEATINALSDAINVLNDNISALAGVIGNSGGARLTRPRLANGIPPKSNEAGGNEAAFQELNDVVNALSDNISALADAIQKSKEG